VAGYCINGSAQSVDSLLDKLVDKGVLSVKEAQDLREESDKDFTKAYSAKSGMPEWVSALKLNGDFRGRYDGVFSENPAYVDRNRLRYRLRFGVTATLNDGLEAGFRLASSEPSGTFGGDSISGNTSFNDNGSKKFVYLDMAYAKWTDPHQGMDQLGHFRKDGESLRVSVHGDVRQRLHARRPRCSVGVFRQRSAHIATRGRRFRSR
jgi:hypothetical protein